MLNIINYMKIKTTMKSHFIFTRISIIFLKIENKLVMIETSISSRTLSPKHKEIKGDFHLFFKPSV